MTFTFALNLFQIWLCVYLQVIIFKSPVAEGKLRKHIVPEGGAYFFAKEVNKEGNDTKKGNYIFFAVYVS